MSDPRDNDLDPADESADEPSGGSLPPSDELEAALREATESVEARAAERDGGSTSGSADKVLLEALSEELQSGKQQFEELSKERDDLQERLLRLQAEFENFRRRGLKERQEAHNYGHQNLVKDLLPTVDNLDRAIDHTRQSDGGDLESLLQGVDMLQRELLGILEQHAVAEIEAMGQAFDPALHEAMSQKPDASVPPNTVIEVLQKGYQLRGRLLRPARVIVASAPKKAKTEGSGAG